MFCDRLEKTLDALFGEMKLALKKSSPKDALRIDDSKIVITLPKDISVEEMAAELTGAAKVINRERILEFIRTVDASLSDTELFKAVREARKTVAFTLPKNEIKGLMMRPKKGRRRVCPLMPTGYFDGIQS